MVFGIYAVDNDSEESRTLRKQIAGFIQKQPHIKSYHAVYSDPKTNKLYCDLVVDYEGDYEVIYKDFVTYLSSLYPDKEIEINIDTEFV